MRGGVVQKKNTDEPIVEQNDADNVARLLAIRLLVVRFHVARLHVAALARNDAMNEP